MLRVDPISHIDSQTAQKPLKIQWEEVKRIVLLAQSYGDQLIFQAALLTFRFE